MKNKRVRALLNFILVAVFIGGLLIFWEPLGHYTLTFFNIKVLGARLAVFLVALVGFLEGLNFLGVIHWFDD